MNIKNSTLKSPILLNMRMKKYLLKNDPIQTGKKKSKSIKSQGVYNIMKTSLTPWGLWVGGGGVCD
jgi:hypothetical protein